MRIKTLNLGEVWRRQSSESLMPYAEAIPGRKSGVLGPLTKDGGNMCVDCRRFESGLECHTC